MPPTPDNVALKALYRSAYRLHANILLLQNWQKELHAKISQLLGAKQGWSRFLAVQALLSEHKLRYLQFAAGEIVRNKAAIVAQINLTANTLPKLMDVLKQKLKELRCSIQAQEQTLMPPANMAQIAPRIAHFILQTPYFKLPESWMRTSEAFTHHPSLQSVPILNIHFEESDLRGLSYVGGVLYLGMDIWASQKIGLTFSLLNTLIQCVWLDINTLLKLSIHGERDELFVLQNYAYLKLFMGLIVHVGFYSLLTGISLENIFLFTTTYMCALFCQYVANRLTVAFIRPPHLQNMALLLAQQISYVSGTFLG